MWQMNLRVAKIIFLAALLGTTGRALRAQSPQPSEYQVKAAYLYNFAKFVEWPSSGEDKHIVIGILGQNPFGAVLENTVKNKSVNGHKLEVKTVTSIAELRNCQIAFISRSEKRRLREIRDGLKGANVLTVGDGIEGFIEAGGIINFAIEEDQVRFDINDYNAKMAGLQISSKLLDLARNRKGGP